MFKPRSPGYLYDLCDGYFYRQHPVFTIDKQALQIVIYYDEVETANPLGSYRGVHKIGNNFDVHVHVLSTLYMHVYINVTNVNLCRTLLLFSGKH